MITALRVLGSCRGFTLPEVLVGAAIIGLVMAGVAGLLASGEQAYLRGVRQVEAQQTARVAMERLVRDIRGAGIDPANTRYDAITAPTATGFVLQTDWNGNGVIEPGITGVVNGIAHGERVTYSLAGQDLRRQESAVDGAPQVVASPVDQVAFQYLDADDAPTVTPANIRTIAITLRGRPSTPPAPALGTAVAVVADRVRLRNRQ